MLKRSLVVMMVLVAKLLIASAAASQTLDVVAYWKFDELQGDTVLDSSGNNFHGTNFGALRTPGLKGGALRFDGVDDKVIVAHDPGLDVTGAITIEAIFKPLGPQPSGFVPIIAKNTPGNCCTGYSLFITGDSTSATLFTYQVAPPVSLNQWHHVAFQHDGVTARFFIDGAPAGEWPPGEVRSAAPDSRQVEIGGSDHPTRATFSGLIDEIRISRGMLAPSELLRLNRPPVALCRDAEVDADPSCLGSLPPSALDAGSFDPDGDALSFELEPGPPYGLGVRAVDLLVGDGEETSICSAAVSVTDRSAPVIACNAPRTVPTSESSLSFTASATDNCGVGTVRIARFECRTEEDDDDDDEACPVRADGATLTILDAEEPMLLVWRVEAEDESGNRLTQRCETRLVDVDDDDG